MPWLLRLHLPLYYKHQTKRANSAQFLPFTGFFNNTLIYFQSMLINSRNLNVFSQKLLSVLKPTITEQIMVGLQG